MGESPDNLTVLLRQWAAGDRQVENELFEIVALDLRRIARALLRRETPGQSMQSMELVNEAYMRIVNARNQDWRDRRHFFALTARMMRRFLIDKFRARPKARVLPLDDLEMILPGHRNDPDLAITIDRLLNELEKENPELCVAVEMKFFLGLTDSEAAEILDVSERTFQRRWLDARIWLLERLGVARAAKQSG
jgi:RNA polymerase sigma factor (TIGR02999 family)